MFQALAILLIAISVSWLVTGRLIPILRRRGVLDIPNARSSHTVPTPRGGGLGIIAGLVAGVLTAVLLGLQSPRAELLLGAGLIALISFLDDRLALSARLRFALQLIAAAMVLARAGGLEYLPLPGPLDLASGYLAVPLALAWIVGVTNIFNFLDGIDGFAGLQGALAGLGLALLGQADVFTAVGLAIAGACSGFLFHNWHPAKVFMGDVGSGTLGFLLAALPFELPQAERRTAVFAVAMFLWFFLSDGVFTILRRLSRGEKIWVAHRSHLYQRLTAAGLRHHQVTLRVLSAAGLLTLLAVAAVRRGSGLSQWLVFGLALAGFLAYAYLTVQKERASSAAPPASGCASALQPGAEIKVN
jgi:UDP-N-acetylmuramyl pentapeptide phosphotransferase/UDP-N-acetylglucosamine-1-phosphate transferase